MSRNESHNNNTNCSSNSNNSKKTLLPLPSHMNYSGTSLQYQAHHHQMSTTFIPPQMTMPQPPQQPPPSTLSLNYSFPATQHQQHNFMNSNKSNGSIMMQGMVANQGVSINNQSTAVSTSMPRPPIMLPRPPTSLPPPPRSLPPPPSSLPPPPSSLPPPPKSSSSLPTKASIISMPMKMPSSSSSTKSTTAQEFNSNNKSNILLKRPSKAMTIKMNLSNSANKLSSTKRPVEKKSIAEVFNNDEPSDEEDMPPEAKMRMRNIGKDTPTPSGPNSFNKTKLGFCNTTRIFEKQLEKAFEEVEPSSTKKKLW